MSSEIARLIEVMNRQLEAAEKRHIEEKEAAERRHDKQLAAAEDARIEAERRHKEDMKTFAQLFQTSAPISGGANPQPQPQISNAAIPPFAAFDSTSELWPDYWSRFCTFIAANAVPDARRAQVFLTNQTPNVYKQLANLAAQQNPKKDTNELSMDELVNFMKEQFNLKLLMRERFKFWSNMEWKPGETLQELAARIRHDAATCDFPSIADPQDEALRQRFICSVNNEAVLKALLPRR